MRALLWGDLHAGKSRSLYPERLQEQSDTLEQILALGRNRHVDVILGLGDTFDRRRPDVPEMLAVEQPLVRHRDAGGPPVHLLVGNHEVGGVDDVTPVDVLAEAGLVVAHRRPEVFGVAGVGIACLPWTPVSRLVAAQGGGDRDEIHVTAAELLVQAARELRDLVDGPAILCHHWSVSGSSLPSGLPVDELRETVLPLAEIEAIGFDLIAGAHIHRGGTFGTHSMYVGSPMCVDHSEAAVAHGCWLVDTVRAFPEFVPLESRRFVTIGLVDLEDLSDAPGAVVRVKDTLPAGESFDAREIRDRLLAAGAKRVDLAITVERAARLDREPVLDTDREPEQLLAAWLDQEGVEDSERLVELARTYLAGERAAVA